MREPGWLDTRENSLWGGTWRSPPASQGGASVAKSGVIPFSLQSNYGARRGFIPSTQVCWRCSLYTSRIIDVVINSPSQQVEIPSSKPTGPSLGGPSPMLPTHSRALSKGAMLLSISVEVSGLGVHSSGRYHLKGWLAWARSWGGLPEAPR